MKKLLLALFVIGIIVLGWFLFLKPGDFTARITSKTNVGTIEQSIKNWQASAPVTRVTLSENKAQLIQEFSVQDSTHIYEWNVTRVNDTVSETIVHVTDPKHSILNRLKRLVSETDFEKKSKAIILEFHTKLEDHLDRINIKIDGEDTLPEKFYAYTELEGPQILKANGMMKDISHLQNAMVRYNIEMKGDPFVRITEWNRETDSIKYQFAFPIIKEDSLPEIIDIKYATRPEIKALKATYNGNYITSDRAWYALLEYAKTNKIEIDPRPIEVFYNNPSMGGDESRWKAEIFMPIIE